MLRIITFTFLIVLLVLIFLEVSTGFNFISEIVMLALGALLSQAFKYLPFFKLHIKTTFSPKRNNNLRATFSYLIKIGIKDEYNESKYLLVKNGHFEAYQPPGGVYKYQDRSYLEGIGAKDDSNFHKEGDLRIKTKRKYFPELLRKFNSKKGREVSIEREFHEELISTNIFNRDDFPYLNYSYIRTDLSDIGYSIHFKCDEIKVFDIFELHLNERQKQIVRSLLEKESDKYILVNEQEITKELYRKSKDKTENRITDTSILILKPSI